MDKINFTINGERIVLSGAEISPATSLNDYIRNHLQLLGTKAMCYEGGCGACVVSATIKHPVTKEKRTLAVNSCLIHILSCHEWDIKTVEGIGNRISGYNTIQNRLAAFNGTQCGYCSPGWVMNMYSLEQSNKNLTMQQIEDSFGGSLCRCTGYRPILDAFKSFATEEDANLQDLEDLHIKKCSKPCSRRCSLTDDWCVFEKPGTMLQVDAGNGRWYKAYTLLDVFMILSREGGSPSYRLIAGDTGKGVYPIPLSSKTKILIDISSIEALRVSHSDENLILGAGMTLTEVMDVFKEWSKKNDDFSYLETLYNHLGLVAHVPVRNIGTIGGNLALKNQHNAFPSDVFLLLESIGATVTIVNKKLDKTELQMSDLLQVDLKERIITEVKLPPLSKNCMLRTYKIMPRAQNAHAIVNGGFLFRTGADKLIKSANIVYGNINPDFIKAKQTEKFLIGKSFNNNVLQESLALLNKEIIAVDLPPEPSPMCRKSIALGLFYKAILSLSTEVNPHYKSGGEILQRPVSKGVQTYETDKSLWPLNEPVAKLEALAQCSGEATYACDVYSGPRAVHVALVLSDVSSGTILGFDTTAALQITGVIAFYSAKDIPGKNSFTFADMRWLEFDEEIFASETVLYYGQPLGVVVAVNRTLALTAAELVKVNYKTANVKPVLSIADALQCPDKDKRIRKEVTVEATSQGSEICFTFNGTFSMPPQYQFTMETHCCNVSVDDNGLTVRSSTQWMDLVNVAVAQALGIDENKVLVDVPRIGGSYGGKSTRSALIACACSIAAFKLNRTATLSLPLTHNMAALGKRCACQFDYECGVNDRGIIQYLNVHYYSDVGSNFNDTPAAVIAQLMTVLYKSNTWNITGYSVLTDKTSETWCRAPATTEAMTFTDHIMERISYITGHDHIDVRLENLSPNHGALLEMISSFKIDAEYDERITEIVNFNKNNAWKKRSLKMSIMAYPIAYYGNFPVTVSIYHNDGTVALSHGGIEMGQGINTKVAQVCAYSLKIPLDKVAVRRSNTFVSPNSTVAHGSITSDSVAHATLKACEILLGRLEAVRKELYEPTWEEVVKKAYQKGIDLQATYMTSANDRPAEYTVYGVCASEVELDVLTGTHLIRRLDLLEDTGISMSPEIDVGQIEGAFIMGLGLWTSENLVYDKNTGRLLTDRTWTYKIPGAKDIPVDFRVSFRRNAANPGGVLRSKTTGEPALVLSVVVINCLHDCILEARKEYGYQDKQWVPVDTPYTVENILQAISPRIESYKLT